jgi:hypothetical protein
MRAPLAATLATPVGADLGAVSSHTLTLTENEAVPSLSVADVTVAEGPGVSAAFAVTLSAVCGQAVTVAYATANGTATAGQDYTATSGTLTIPAGSTSGTVSVPILDDALFEPNEHFTLTLSSPTSPLTLSRATATATIVDTQRPIDRVRRDAVVWQGTTGTWQVRRGSDNYQSLSTYQWGSGALGDIPVPGDYDGDGVIDLAVWRRPTGAWLILQSSTSYNPASPLTFQWGGGTPTVTSGVVVIAQPPVRHLPGPGRTNGADSCARRPPLEDVDDDAEGVVQRQGGSAKRARVRRGEASLTRRWKRCGRRRASPSPRAT